MLLFLQYFYNLLIYNNLRSCFVMLFVIAVLLFCYSFCYHRVIDYFPIVMPFLSFQPHFVVLTFPFSLQVGVLTLRFS